MLRRDIQMRRCLLAIAILTLAVSSASAEPKLKALILDGQNNHNWKATTPVLKHALESSGLFTVDVATSPAKGKDISEFKPEFSKYNVVVSNYNGQMWSQETQDALLSYVKGGGGFVVIHAADNSFGGWEEYNKMIGLGGWGGRNEKHGPYVYIGEEGKLIRDTRKGSGGGHGPQHPFQIIVRDREHPITKGMPMAWMHGKDELYERLRGPAENMKVLATALAAKSKRGSGNHEPMIFTIDYGKGRVFHTPMGHAAYSMECVGFIVTLQRGSEWAATGKVTQEIPKDFPNANEVSNREIKIK